MRERAGLNRAKPQMNTNETRIAEAPETARATAEDVALGQSSLVAVDPRGSFGQPIIFRDGIPPWFWPTLWWRTARWKKWRAGLRFRWLPSGSLIGLARISVLRNKWSVVSVVSKL